MRSTLCAGTCTLRAIFALGTPHTESARSLTAKRLSLHLLSPTPYSRRIQAATIHPDSVIKGLMWGYLR
jgi:hypothetical protein